jgi:hypothetical protein
MDTYVQRVLNTKSHIIANFGYRFFFEHKIHGTGLRILL